MRYAPMLILALVITTAANAQQVSLSVSDWGYMTLHWTATNPGSYDRIALYDGDPRTKGPDGYLTYQWQWASRTPPHVTGTQKGFNYYVAYLAQACLSCARQIKAVAGPYVMPAPVVSLSVSEWGFMTLNWQVSQPGFRDFVALYDGDPTVKGTNGYLTSQYQKANRASPHVTIMPEGFNYWAAYIEEDAGGNRRFRAIAKPDACLATGSTVGDAYVATLNRCLTERYGASHAGSAFALTTNNVLSGRWVEQTPSVWGKAAAAVPAGAGSYVANDIQALISQAEQFVDITTLAPFPDGPFQTAILNGLTAVARSGRPVTVRILVGWPPIATNFSSDGVKEFLDYFANPLSRIDSSKVTLYVAAQRVTATSWNHAKMVAVDGNAILLGGENQWAKDYLGTTPVHDLNVIVRGPGALAGHRFADLLWQGVCSYVDPIWLPWSWEPGQRIDHRDCLPTAGVTAPAGQGSVSVLGAGRYGKMADATGAVIQPSDYAMALTLNAATTNIRIAQQGLGFQAVTLQPPIFWADGMNAIAKAIANERDVYIVMSNDGSKGGSNPYSMVTVTRTADELRSYVATASGKQGKALNDLLCKRLHLSTLRFGPSDAWPGGVTFANHSKFFMVDDNVAYVGSSNLYSSDLQEYGVFLSDPQAIAALKSQYWDELWKYSSRVAISGTEAASCYFHG